jgi:hypothetical protein
MRWLVLLIAVTTLGCKKQPPRKQHVPKVHRASAEKCSEAPRASHPAPKQQGDCKTDADCTAGKNGQCVDVYIGQGDSSAECRYDTCFSDADCKAGPCECGDPEGVHRCGGGSCRIDADCKGSYCSPSPGDCGPGWGRSGWFCHTPNDECVDDSDCTKQGEGYCWFDARAAHWACRYGECQD